MSIVQSFFASKAKLIAREKASYMFTKRISIASKFDFMPLLNNRCQFNAVHAVKAGFANKVVEVIMIDNESASAHYINEIDGVGYVDFTLGWSWSGGDYRFVRYVDESEHEKINESLKLLKKRICEPLPWWCKWLDPFSVC